MNLDNRHFKKFRFSQLSKKWESMQQNIQGDADSGHDTCFNVGGPSKVKQARRNQPQLLEKSKYPSIFNFKFHNNAKIIFEYET
jgi:hypothetical protein